MSAVLHPYGRSFRPMPVAPELELVPLEPAKRGFESRPAPLKLSERELEAIDRALAAKKATASYRDLSDHFALQQQNRGGLS